jgi:hypothetical protein
MSLFKKDWQRRIDNAEKQRKKEEERVRREQERKKVMEEAQRDAEMERQMQKEYQERLREHQQHFRCHICGKPSEKPGVHEIVETLYYSDDFRVSRSRVVDYKTDWNLPTGLSKCSKCGRWTCPKHIYKGICRQCALQI